MSKDKNSNPQQDNPKGSDNNTNPNLGDNIIKGSNPDLPTFLNPPPPPPDKDGE